MNTDREFLKWAWPEYSVVFPIDFMLTVTIIGMTAAFATMSYYPYTFRAKLSEVWYASSQAKYALIEQLALSGDTPEVPLVDATRVVSSVTMDDHLSGRKAVVRQRVDLTDQEQAKKAVEENRRVRESGEGGLSKYVSSTRIEGGAIIISGKIDDRTYDFGIYPAVLDEEVPSVYVWLCGRGPIPEGWLAQPPMLTNRLPDYLLFRDCRRRRDS